MPNGWDGPRITAFAIAFCFLAIAVFGPRFHPGFPPPPSGPLDITVSVDTSTDNHPISPYIYGLAHATPETVAELRLGSHRWGGNPNTRHNWEINAWNHARDWQFANYGDTKPESRAPGNAADQFVEANRRAGAASFLTVPTLGWVAKDPQDSSRSVDVPNTGGLPVSAGSDAVSGYDPSANRARTSIRSFARKNGPFEDPPNSRDNAVYQDEWIHHLVRKFGKAADGGVRFYAMDNEPDLWDGTHTDIHPARPGYDDILKQFLDYATAVKAVDPTAQVTGPVSWGWTGYIHSPRDRDRWNDRPDRKAHGDLELIPWFLRECRKHDERASKRTLDVLDVHFYPQAQGVYGTKSDPTTDALRIRSTAALWDPGYKDESWIKEPVMLIPRMKKWIEEQYPGTKLGLTEWNWGADETPAGAVAIAECLGVFGREGLYIANYWTSPKPQSAGYYAFKIFRNADGQGAGFGDRTARAASSMPDALSCFASVDGKTGNPVLMLVNKTPEGIARARITLKHARPLQFASTWRIAPGKSGIQALPDIPVSGGIFSYTAPPYSITLLRLK